MRVVVASDAVAGLTPAAASEQIARAFAERGVAVAVVPLAATGQGLREGVAACCPSAVFAAPTTTAELAGALASGADQLVVDLSGLSVDDLGRSLFDADPAGSLAELRRSWAGHDLTALVPEEEVERPLTGLSGHASIALRAEGADLNAILLADAEAERWAAELGVEPSQGSGAARGLGLILASIGGQVTDPLTFLAARFDLAATMARSDLVITGAESLDFHALGGPVVKRVAQLAGAALRPVIAVVGRNFVSSRELRLGGFETAYPLVPAASTQDATPERLAEVAEQVASTWQW